MSGTLNRVFIAGTGSFLPNEPVPNAKIDDVLGHLTNAPERVQSFIRTIGTRMLATSGIEQRHFAIDPVTGWLTHTVAGLAERACISALEDAGLRAADVELLILASSNYDETTPPTSALLQEKLGIEVCAEMEIHSNCSGVGKAVQIAYDALRVGRYRTALIVYPQISSVYLRTAYLNQPQMTKKHAALRYILADGCGAIVLQSSQAGPGERLPREIIGTLVESVGGKLPPGMTAGGGVANLADPAKQVHYIYDQGLHHLDQDFAAVNRDASRLLLEGIAHMLDRLGIERGRINHYILSIPSLQLYDDGLKRFSEYLSCPIDEVKGRIKFRARDVGYCGGASILLHLDELARNGEAQAGELVVVHSVESSKWMTGGFVVKW